jgi:hypothetical protein
MNRQNNSKGLMMMANAIIPRPPPISNYQVQHSTRLRFSSFNNAVDKNITFQNLLDTLLMAATATAGYDLFRFVKVRAVEVWATNSLGGNDDLPANVEVTFLGNTAGLVGDVSVHTDISMGVEPAHVKAIPNSKSLASDFQVSSSAVAFKLQVPPNSVIDVSLTFRGQFVAPVAAQNALVGATAGDVYLRGLDGVATSGTQLPTVLSDYQI